jgi:hypothetical protein
MGGGADDLLAHQASQPAHSLVQEGGELARELASIDSVGLRPRVAELGGFRIESKQTNKALLEWVDNGKTAEEFEYRQRLRELGRLQSLEVQDAVNALGLTEEYPPIYATQYSKHPEKATVVDLFHVYAPDLEYASQK